jgi:DNA repair ATPase RecN
MEFRHNHSLSEIETLCDQAKSDNQKCLEDTEHNAVTISELRGRLEGHAHAATLAPKYNLLLENHLKAGRLIEELQSLLKEKQDDLDKRIHVNREQKDALNVAEELRRTYEATVNHIQKRQSALCRESFGLGPYYVHFSIIFDGGQKRTFVVVSSTCFNAMCVL